MDLGLAGKTAIVTGGAKGIGAGICRVLAEEGANIVVNYRSDPELCEAFARGLAEETGVKTIAVQADVSTEEGCDTVWKAALGAFERIDILVNNAGGGFRKPFTELDYADWRRVQDNSLNSQFLMSRRFTDHCLPANRGGHIVNVLSKSAITTNSTHNTSYVSAKGGALALTRGMANELTPLGIIVNGIVPGYVINSKGTFNPETNPYAKKLIEEIIPTKRFGTPREMGNVVAFLCSERASQIIGAIVDCSGGTML